jgi:ribosomal protein S18 acetylase RimI-like enzyme
LPTFEILPIPVDALDRIHEIDVSETTEFAFVQQGSRLERRAELSRREWLSSEDWAEEVNRWKGYVTDGGAAFGAFGADRVVGFSVLRSFLTATAAQLAGLYVDRVWRRCGVATALVDAVIASAREKGSTNLYVSSSRYESAVEFYLGLGFEPLNTPHPELFELEPSDIHMSLAI